MEITNEQEIINTQFLKAVDFLTNKLQENDEKDVKIEDTYFGKLTYPSNRYYIGKVREGSKSVPHMAMIALARQYDIDFNFFYDSAHNPSDMFTYNQSAKPISKEEKKQQTRDLKRTFEDIDSKYSIVRATVKDREAFRISTVEDETTLLLEALRDMVKQNRNTLYEPTTRRMIDEVMHYIRMYFDKSQIISDLEKELDKLQTDNTKDKTDIKSLTKELDLCKKEVKEFSKIALEAQKAEAAALRRLLDK